MFVCCRLTPGSPLTSSAVTLSPTSSLKLVLTTTEDKTGKKPHQAFLTLKEVDSGLEESFPLSVKENGKGKLDLV
jgi:oligosaccharyltransferase complex subunit delta (ribophorin II)